MNALPQKPTMLYDGDCGFCKYWITKWEKWWQGKILCAPYQEMLTRYPQVTREECQDAVQLILPDGKVYAGAHAVFHGADLAGKYRLLLALYERFPFFDRAAESIYQWVAHHRFFLSRLFGHATACTPGERKR